MHSGRTFCLFVCFLSVFNTRNPHLRFVILFERFPILLIAHAICLGWEQDGGGEQGREGEGYSSRSVPYCNHTNSIFHSFVQQ